MDTLNGTSGGKGPAGTALTLVLDGGDSSCLHPVHGGGGSDGGVRNSLGGLGFSEALSAIEVGAKVESTVLGVGEIGKGIGSNCILTC